MSGPEQLLAQLRDIHLPLAPESASAGLPSIAGLLVAALVGAMALGYWLWRRRRFAALRSLRTLARNHARNGDTIELARALAALLRAHAARRFPASPVAGMIGQEWLGFLDAHGGGGDFRHGPGAVLADLPYRATADVAVDERALLALAERWLRANPG